MVVGPVGGAQRRPWVVPRAAAHDPAAAIAGEPGRAVRRRAAIVVVVAVGGPLPDIAGHVEQAERVRLVAVDRRRVAEAVIDAGEIREGGRLAGIVAPPEFGLPA